MDWGNAFVRSKTLDTSGVITAITMELHLQGDFRKTKKKVTWLSQATPSNPLISATLLDYDYLITKKKLEENDDVKDFVTPVTEFREDAWADANIQDLKKGDIIQFERKGYYILDGIVEAEGAEKTLEFIHIPDGRAASLASRAGAATDAATSVEKGGVRMGKGGTNDAKPEDVFRKADLRIPVETKMYRVEKVYGEGAPEVEGATKMYKVPSVYRV